jgi:hypothetical protein
MTQPYSFTNTADT